MQTRDPRSKISSNRAPAVGEGGSTTERRNDKIIFSKMYGFVSANVVVQMHKDIVALIRQDSPKFWLVDTSAVSGFDAIGIPSPAGMFLKDLKNRNFMVIGVITSGPVRMMGSTLCFGAGIKHKFFNTKIEAEHCVSALLSEGVRP